MGKKRIAVMDGSEPTKKTAKEKRQLIKTGKDSGRVTDMGAVALAEAEEIKKKEKELEKEAAKAAKKAAKTPKQKKVIKKRGKRYLAAKKQIDNTKFYPLFKAIKLVKKTSISRFNGKVELHLVVKEKNFKRKIKLPHPLNKQPTLMITTEKKVPVIHLVIGKLDTKEAHLSENFTVIIESVGTGAIKKAVLTSTMGPGIKVDLTSL